jgi:hypothetical protein
MAENFRAKSSAPRASVPDFQPFVPIRPVSWGALRQHQATVDNGPAQQLARLAESVGNLSPTLARYLRVQRGEEFEANREAVDERIQNLTDEDWELIRSGQAEEVARGYTSGGSSEALYWNASLGREAANRVITSAGAEKLLHELTTADMYSTSLEEKEARLEEYWSAGGEGLTPIQRRFYNDTVDARRAEFRQRLVRDSNEANRQAALTRLESDYTEALRRGENLGEIEAELMAAGVSPDHLRKLHAIATTQAYQHMVTELVSSGADWPQIQEQLAEWEATVAERVLSSGEKWSTRGDIQKALHDGRLAAYQSWAAADGIARVNEQRAERVFKETRSSVLARLRTYLTQDPARSDQDLMEFARQVAVEEALAFDDSTSEEVYAQSLSQGDLSSLVWTARDLTSQNTALAIRGLLERVDRGEVDWDTLQVYMEVFPQAATALEQAWARLPSNVALGINWGEKIDGIVRPNQQRLASNDSLSSEWTIFREEAVDRLREAFIAKYGELLENGESTGPARASALEWISGTEARKLVAGDQDLTMFSKVPGVDGAESRALVNAATAALRELEAAFWADEGTGTDPLNPFNLGDAAMATLDAAVKVEVEDWLEGYDGEVGDRGEALVEAVGQVGEGSLSEKIRARFLATYREGKGRRAGEARPTGEAQIGLRDAVEAEELGDPKAWNQVRQMRAADASESYAELHKMTSRLLGWSLFDAQVKTQNAKGEEAVLEGDDDVVDLVDGRFVAEKSAPSTEDLRFAAAVNAELLDLALSTTVAVPVGKVDDFGDFGDFKYKGKYAPQSPEGYTGLALPMLGTVLTYGLPLVDEKTLRQRNLMAWAEGDYAVDHGARGAKVHYWVPSKAEYAEFAPDKLFLFPTPGDLPEADDEVWGHILRVYESTAERTGIDIRAMWRADQGDLVDTDPAEDPSREDLLDYLYDLQADLADAHRLN